MHYTIIISEDGTSTIQFIKPENASIAEDIYAVGLFAKSMYESLDTDAQRNLFLQSITKVGRKEFYTTNRPNHNKNS